MRQKKLVSQQGGSTSSSHTTDDGVTDSSSSSSQFSSVPDLSTQHQQPFQIFTSDPRSSDPHLKKFFFRQRVTSSSKHPGIHYQLVSIPY